MKTNSPEHESDADSAERRLREAERDESERLECRLRAGAADGGRLLAVAGLRRPETVQHVQEVDPQEGEQNLFFWESFTVSPFRSSSEFLFWGVLQDFLFSKFLKDFFF